MFKLIAFLILVFTSLIDYQFIELTYAKGFSNYNLMFIIFTTNVLMLFFTYLSLFYDSTHKKHTSLNVLSYGLLGMISAGVPISLLIIFYFNFQTTPQFIMYSVSFCVINFILFSSYRAFFDKPKHKYQREFTKDTTVETIGEGRDHTVYEMHRLKRDGLFPIIMIEVLISLSSLLHWLNNMMKFDLLNWLLVIFGIIFATIYIYSHTQTYTYGANSTLNH